MSASSQPKRIKGIGRVAFISHLAEITADLDAGWPVKAVYQKQAGNLGISYVQFTRYVGRIVRQGDHSRAPARGPTPSAPPPAPVSQADTRGPHHAGHQSARRTFNHDPIERPDDRRRLLGEE
jgi:Family of unknown function (DUF5338)